MTSAITGYSGFAPVNDTSLYYEVSGSGHPLVLLHGGLLDCRMWDDQFAVFAQSYRVVRYDLRGTGKSAQADGNYSDHHDLAALLAFLGIERTYLVGLSGGGALAIDFTLNYSQQVAALVLAASGLSGYEWSEDIQTFGSTFSLFLTAGDISGAVEYRLRLLTDGLGRTPGHVAPAVRERVRIMISDALTQPHGSGQAQGNEPPAISRLADIDKPTLILIGDRDLPDMRRIANQLAAGISGARQIVMPNVAHMINLEQASRFNQSVLDFLNTVNRCQQ